MSEHLSFFKSPGGTVTVALPFDFRQAIKDWTSLRLHMARHVPVEFTRDEWAYLVTFLERDNLLSPFQTSFGAWAEPPKAVEGLFYSPRGPIAVWLPNNVSLLGPLILILLSLTGQAIQLKLGSSAQDLCGAFLNYALSNLPAGDLSDYLATRVQANRFERDDPRQRELAGSAAVRIVFGTDESAAAIHALPHPLDSVGFSFTDRQSEAWLEQARLSDKVLTTLIEVFAVYGQAGCTSPRRVVLIDGSPREVGELRDRLVALWPKVVTEDAAMHIASSNVMAQQCSRALGWDARLAPRNAALVAGGPRGLADFDAPMALRIVGATRQQALEDLPANIQTIGHALVNAKDSAWLDLLAGSRVLRFVPLGKMHHFSSAWDGHEFWRQCFQVMEIRI